MLWSGLRGLGFAAFVVERAVDRHIVVALMAGTGRVAATSNQGVISPASPAIPNAICNTVNARNLQTVLLI
jgi:hypothetical protein